MKIANIHMSGNEHGHFEPDAIYADLIGDDGGLVISATLQYVLRAICGRNYKVDGVKVIYETERGDMCSTVKFDPLTAAATRVEALAAEICNCMTRVVINATHSKACPAFYLAKAHAAIIKGEDK